MRRLHALLTAALLVSACKGDDGTASASASETNTETGTGTTASTTSTTSTTSATATTTETSGTGTASATGTTTADTTGTTGTAGTTGTTAVTGTTGDPGPCEPVVCDMGKIYECGDCIDNDGDGKVDIADIECITPCDNDESSFASGLPGDNMDPCNQDCYFDGNSGGGDDKCTWSLKCDPNNPGGDVCPYDPNYKNCPDMQSQQCTDFCAVPNGCDCFGCCTIEFNGMSYDIFLGDPDCTIATIDSCAQCTKNEQCDNVCVPENCELCFGQTELPPGCEMPTCENADACTIDDMGNDNCPAGFFCSTGCCVPIIPG